MRRAMTLEPLPGGLAQLARAPALHAGGHRFESDILHTKTAVGPNKRSLFKDIGPVEDHYVIRSGARKQEVLY